MANTLARITGVAIHPGVSKNNRLYTKELIARAVERAQERIREGTAPMTMLTHHLAGDDSVQIVGRIANWTLDSSGAANFEAFLANTAPARTIATLVDPNEAAAFLKGVSIRGGWLGTVRNKMYEGRMVETGDDLELDGLDFTKTPGVTGAQVDSLTYTDGFPQESDNRQLIYETVQEATVTLTEDAPATDPAKTWQSYADPGYQADNAPRWPLDTLAQARIAWGALRSPKLIETYSKKQHVRISERIKRALEKHGATVDATNGWIITPATESVTEYCDYDDRAASFSVNVDNGMVSISVSSWRIDPTDLEVCARAAMQGACLALNAMDPDNDGDMDAATGPVETTESVTENNPESTPDAGTEDEETGVADQDTTPAADAPQTTTPAPAAAAPAATAPTVTTNVTLSADQFAQLLGSLGQPTTVVAEKPAGELVGAGAPAETAPAATPATEAAPAAAPAADGTKTLAQLVAEGVAAALPDAVKAALPVAIQEAAQGGALPGRKGLVTQVGESATATADPTTTYPEGWPTAEDGAPLEAHKLTEQQWRNISRPAVVGAVLGGRTRQAAQ